MEALVSLKLYRMYLKPFYAQIAWLSFWVSLSALATLPIPIVYSYFVDQVLNMSDRQLFLPVVLGLIGLQLLTVVLGYLSDIYGAKLLQSFRSSFRSTYYQQIQRIPHSQLTQFMSGDIVARLMGDLEELSLLMPDGLAGILKDCLLVIGLISILFYMNWKLTLCAAVLIPCLCLIFSIMFKTLRFRARDHYQKRGRLQASFQEKIEGHKEIQVSHAFDFHEKEADTLIMDSERAVFSISIQNSRIQAALGVLGVLTTMVLWGVGGFWHQSMGISVGDIIGFSYAFQALFDPLSSLLSMGAQIPLEVEALNRILTPLTQERSFEGTLDKPITGLLCLDNLSFSYPTGSPVLSQITLMCRPGKAIVIHGINGSGKSTLLSLMMRLQTPSSGSITLDNESLSTYRPECLSRSITLISQHSHFFSGTLKDNVLMGRKSTPEWFEQISIKSGMNRWVQLLPDGYQTYVSEKALDLSGGQRQTLAIARALLSNPRVILFDEPLTHLDAESTQHFMQIVDDLKQRSSVVIVSHQKSLVEKGDEHYELSRGRLVKGEIYE